MMAQGNAVGPAPLEYSIGWLAYAGLKNLLDQLVITVGAGLVVHDRHEHVRAVDEHKHLGGSRTADGGTGRHRKFVEDRGGQHELRDFWRLSVEDLIQEIVGDGMAAQLEPIENLPPVIRVMFPADVVPGS